MNKVKHLSRIAQKVLIHLQCEWRWDDGGNSWDSFKALAGEIGESLEDTKKAVHELRDAKIVHYNTCTDYDGKPHGSGYFLDPKFDPDFSNYYKDQKI